MTRVAFARGLPYRKPARRVLPQVLKDRGAESGPEIILLNRVLVWGLPRPTTQAKLIDGRMFRYDFCWPEYRVAVEVQGGLWVKGGHVRGLQFESDAEKSALAQIAGYICIAVSPGMVQDGRAQRLITDALLARGWPGISKQ